MAATNGVEKEELAALSAEEQAALADDAGESAALDEIIGDDDSDDLDSADEGDDEAVDEAEADDAGDEVDAESDKPEEPAKEEPAAETTAAATEQVASVEVPTYNYMLPVNFVEDYEGKMKAIANGKADLRKKLDEGEIDMGAYEDAKDALSDQASDLRIQQSTATNNQKANENAARARWDIEQEVFFGAEANKVYTDNVYVAAAFNQAVMDLAKDEKNQHWSGPKFLAEADKIIRAQFQLGAAAKEEAPKSADKRRPDLSKVPKTLANLPNAESETTNTGEFAALEKLDGMALEQALSRLTPEQQDRYART